MDTTQIVYTVVALLLVVGAGYLLYVTRAFGKDEAIRQLVEFSEIVRYAVSEANKMYEMSNDDKYSYVYKIASSWLKDRGVNLPAEAIRQLIEGAVDIVKRAKN